MKETKKLNGWSLAFFIVAALLAVAAIYMLIATITYIKSYIDYGYSFKDVGGVQTIISAVVPYLFYAFASFGIGLVLKQLLPAKEKKEKKAKAEPVLEEAAAVEALPEVEEVVEEDDFEDLVTEEPAEEVAEEVVEEAAEVVEETAEEVEEEK